MNKLTENLQRNRSLINSRFFSLFSPRRKAPGNRRSTESELVMQNKPTNTIRHTNKKSFAYHSLLIVITRNISFDVY